MTIWNLLMVSQAVLLIALCLHLFRLEKRARFLRGQDKRKRVAENLPRIEREPLSAARREMARL